MKPPSNINFAEALFQKYIEAVYPGQTLPPDQLHEVKRGFYSGMWAAFHEVQSVAEALPEHAAIATLKKFQDDCYALAEPAIKKLYQMN
jgi:hypothetical protein